MDLPFSKKENQYLKEIENRFYNQKTVNFSDEEIQKMRDILDLLCEREVLHDVNADGANMYYCIGSFDAFNSWLSDQEKKTIKLSRREWKIAIVSAVVGAVIGLIPTIISLIGV